MRFKAGDVLVLNGNTHPLTVKTVSGEKVTVVWFDSFWKLHQEQFTADLLEFKELQSQAPDDRPKMSGSVAVDQDSNPRKRG